MVLRKKLEIGPLGRIVETLVDDGTVEEDYLFISASSDLEDYDFVEGATSLLKIAIAAKIDTLIVPVKGKRWEFHKADADPWPSPLHAHHYEAGLKLDAITGKFYRTGTRIEQGRLKPKELRRIQIGLLNSKDFAVRTRQYLGDAMVTQLLGPGPLS